MSLVLIAAVKNGFVRVGVYTVVAGSFVVNSSVAACFKDCTIPVYFNGTYTDETCVVVVNDTSNSGTVSLPVISVSLLKKNGSEAGSVPFDITLKECPASRTITVYFDSSTSSADGETGNLINDTGATYSNNVQIRLRKENSSQVLIDDASSGQDYIISSTAEPLNHRFTASYYAKGDSAVTAGTFHAIAGVKLVYK